MGFIYKLNHLRKKIKNEDLYTDTYTKNNILHGCCLIFTPAFFTKLKGFNPKTFMFREEELLYIELQKNSLINVYTPEICIKHLEDAATNSVYKTASEKNEFLRMNQIKSLNILIEKLELNKININE